MIPNTISDIFQPINDFLYGLDVEIRPKLTPGASTPRWALAAIHPGWGNRAYLVLLCARLRGPTLYSPSHVRHTAFFVA